MKKKISIILFLIMTLSYGSLCGQALTEQEKNIISTRSGDTMRLWLVNNPEDSVLLRQRSEDMLIDDIKSAEFETLCERMLLTVSNPDNPGVGIAAPQVGVLRRVIAVQRFDKEGEPFEIFVNIRIISLSEQTVLSQEGCLSVPDRSGNVLRSAAVEIEYLDPKTLEMKREVVEGFTAIIFQHEIDHLEGVLYIDRLTQVEENEFTEEPLADNKQNIEIIEYAADPAVCPDAIKVSLNGNIVCDVEFLGAGCNGNKQGLAALVRGMTREEVVKRLDNIQCKNKGTSCPDQLAKALRS